MRCCAARSELAKDCALEVGEDRVVEDPAVGEGEANERPLSNIPEKAVQGYGVVPQHIGGLLKLRRLVVNASPKDKVVIRVAHLKNEDGDAFLRRRAAHCSGNERGRP